MTQERLQKLMAQAGLGSRRDNEEVIQAGRVKVNGHIAKLGDKADPATDKIEVNGRILQFATQPKHTYVIVNKPRGVLSSTEDELDQGRKTVRDLIPLPGHLYPVGRLDKESEGLMLLTNDGDLAHKLTHPRYGHEKTYHVVLLGEIHIEKVNQWRQGVLLEEKMTAPAKVEIISRENGLSHLKIVMREGRKRQIRRIANLLGYEVRHLTRQKIGPLSLGSLKPGEWRHLTEQELKLLQGTIASKKAISR